MGSCRLTGLDRDPVWLYSVGNLVFWHLLFSLEMFLVFRRLFLKLWGYSYFLGGMIMPRVGSP